MKFVQNGRWTRKMTKLAYDICDYKFLYYSRNEVIDQIFQHFSRGIKSYCFYEFYVK